MNKYAGYSTQPAIVAEMTNGVETPVIDVPIDKELIEKVIDGDKSPLFVTIEVLNEGVSRNGRSWTKETLLSVAEQINAKKPDGYYGHLSDDERKLKYPQPQTIWLGAKVEEIEGKYRLFAKGYVLPEAGVLRTYLKKAKAVGKNVAVSVYGTAKAIQDRAKGIIHMQNFDLESIDWARPGSEGVRNMGIFSVTSEMTDDSKEGDSMKREEVLQSATKEELQGLEVVGEMITEAVASANEAPAEVVSEMTAVREALGVDEGVSLTETVAEMTARLNEFEIDSQLTQKVEGHAARKVIKSLVVSEMTADETVEQTVDRVLAGETAKSVITEMVDKAPKVAPKVEQPAAVGRKFTNKRG